MKFASTKDPQLRKSFDHYHKLADSYLNPMVDKLQDDVFSSEKMNPKEQIEILSKIESFFNDNGMAFNKHFNTPVWKTNPRMCGVKGMKQVNCGDAISIEIAKVDTSSCGV